MNSAATPALRPMRRPAVARRAMRGAMAVVGALWLGVAVICLMAIDIGHVFWQQRELQKIADMAAMAGAGGERSACVRSIEANATSNGFVTGRDWFVDVTAPGRPPLTEATKMKMCGRWDPKVVEPAAGTGPGQPSQFFDENADDLTFNAARVAVRRTVPYFFVFAWNAGASGGRDIEAMATASRSTPLAALTIRSTLVDIDTQQSALLNLVMGSLLGSALNVSTAGWNGLLAAQINLVDYLLALGATAGDYESLLDSNVKLSRLLEVAAELLAREGGAVEAQAALQALSVAAAVRDLEIRVGDLLNVANGTPAAGLEVGIQAFSLAQGAIQIANGESALASDLTVAVPGLLGLTSKIKVIEKPQTSSIGDPRLINAAAGVLDPNKIYVRTAQVRTLHSFNLTGVTSVVNQLASAITGLLSPLVNFLESVASLNLGQILEDLVGLVACGGLFPACQEARVIYTQVLPNATIDLSIEGAAGEAYVTDHLCEGESKTLDVQANTSLAKIRLGRIQNAFSSSEPITVTPMSVAEIGYTEERYQSCLLSLICTGRQYKNSAGVFVSNSSQARKTVIAGFGVRADIPVAGSQSNRELTYSAPARENLPNLDAPPHAGPGPDPSYQSINATDIVGSLAGSLEGIDISVYQSSGGGLLGGLLTGSVSLINGLLNQLGDVIGSVLAPLLDPAVNALLPFLGIDLASTQVGGRLTCRADVELVY